MQLDGAATLVLTFSVPLQPDQDFAQRYSVVDKKSGKVDGAWELAPNLKELRLRHLEPKARFDCLSRPDADRPEQGDAR